MSFGQFILMERYQKVRGLGDRLELMKEQIDWQPFIPLVKKVFHDSKETGGRPHTDELIFVRSMVLQSCYNLSDQELEFQIHDRLSFQNFIGFPDKVPDFSTFWKIRERLKNEDVEKEIWAELQGQLSQKGYSIQKGVIQDAAFIESDLGKKRHYKEKQAEKKGEKIEYTEKQLSHIDKDASFSVKHGQVHFGYKNHMKCDVDNLLIREYEITTASLHDVNVDLVKEGDITAYRDKGYFGRKLSAQNVEDKTMKRGTRAGPINDEEKLWNRAISSIRSVGERPFGVIKHIFHGGHTDVKNIERVTIKEMFKCFTYNLYQLVTLQKKKLAVAL